MTTESLAANQTPVRASDAEREEVARMVQAAGGEGRLTLAETEERLAGIYSARFRHELTQFTADLPAARSAGRQSSGRSPGRWPVRPRGPLAVHAAVVVVLATVLIVRWLASGVPYFWPAFPLFWLVASLVLHGRLRGTRWRYRDSTVA